MKDNSLIIKEIAFENYAQYQDFYIEFPDPDITGENPIFYFIGDNGAGKTRLFNGIKIALFGSIGYKKENLVNLLSQPIKNSIVENYQNGISNQNYKILFGIVLKVNEYGIESYFKIQRIWIFNKFKFEQDKSLKANIVFDGDKNIKVSYKDTSLDPWVDFEGDINTKLKTWFPEEAREFYFFDGEKLVNLVKGSTIKKKDVIKKILFRTDIPSLEIIFEEIKNQKDEFLDETENLERKSDLTIKAKKRLNDAGTGLSENNSKISSNETKIGELEEELADLKNKEEELGLDEASAGLKEVEAKMIQKFKKLDKERIEIYGQIQSNLGNDNIFEWMLIEDILDEVRNDLDQKMKAGIIPAKFDKQIYEMVIEKKKCILCEHELDDKDLDTLKKRKEEAIDERLNKESRRFIQILDTTKLKISERKTILNQLIKDFASNRQKIDKLGDIPRKDITDYELLKEFRTITKRIAEIDSEIFLLKSEINELKTLIPDLQRELKNARKNYNRKLSEHEKIQDSDLFLQLSTEILDITSELKEELEDEIINFIRNKTDTNFLKLIPEPEKFDGVYIGKEWEFGFFLKGAEVPVSGEEGPSAGQFHVIGLSFLNSISKVAKMTLPILFDTPFGRISKEPKAKIAKNFPKMFEGTQIIFFLTDAEADKMLEHIKGKKGYEIKNPSRIQAYIEEIKENRLLERINSYKKQHEKIITEIG